MYLACTSTTPQIDLSYRAQARHCSRHCSSAVVVVALYHVPVLYITTVTEDHQQPGSTNQPSLSKRYTSSILLRAVVYLRVSVRAVRRAQRILIIETASKRRAARHTHTCPRGWLRKPKRLSSPNRSSVCTALFFSGQDCLVCEKNNKDTKQQQYKRSIPGIHTPPRRLPI